MATPRQQSKGRSPMVNQQRQITSFFSKNPSSPSPSQSPSSIISKQTPDSTSKLKPKITLTPEQSPVTPSQPPKRNKPLMVIGPSLFPSPDSSSTPKVTKTLYDDDVVNKRVRVFWPLDKTWYEGLVVSFDKISSKHLILYDDGQEEHLDLTNEKIEWVGQSSKKSRRLVRSAVIEDEEEAMAEADNDNCDDSEDENWGMDMEIEALEDASPEMDLDDVSDEDACIGSNRRKLRKMTETRKRKVSDSGKIDSSKKRKDGGDSTTRTSKVSLVNVNEGKSIENDGGDSTTRTSKVSLVNVNESKSIENNGGYSTTRTSKVSLVSGNESKSIENNDNNSVKKSQDSSGGQTGNIADRFGTREAQKLRFLGEGRRDAKRRLASDEGYDPRTLYLPPDFVKGLSSGQRQWWEFKSKHMDKVLFFKMGKFYELFEMDAHVGANELHLQYMKGEQPHCGFPEKNFSVNVEKLAQKGYRVLVVEQTETPEQLEIRRKEQGVKDKVVKREICAVVSKGTLTEGEILSANPEASYLMAITETCQICLDQPERIFGVCAVDVASSKIILGQFEDDAECSTLCCLLSELRPVEIIKPAKLLSHETERVLLRHSRNPLVNELVPTLEFWDAEKTLQEVKKIYRGTGIKLITSSLDEEKLHDVDSSSSDGLSCLPDLLNTLVDAGDKGKHAISALGGALFYLKQAFLDETLVRFAKFELLPYSGLGSVSGRPYMVLDASAFENLEIFENSRNGDSSGTLYAQLNHCVTAFGKRLLKTWLARPLCHLESIKERQDAISCLKESNLHSALEFRKELFRLPDMERLLARLFGNSEANGRNANKVVLYEDNSKRQLQEFVSTLCGCELMAQSCSSFGAALKNVQSRPLHDLLTPGEGLPNVHPILKHFKDAFDWTEANNSGRIIPNEGVDAEYDSACAAVVEVESSLRKHLKEQRKLLGDASINYVTIGKDSYLLEVPESLSKSIPRNYELQSSKKGFFRYWNPTIKELMIELTHAESDKETKLKSILQRLVRRFCENRKEWRQLISAVAELDVLISLTIAGDYFEGPTCRPVISGFETANKVSHLKAKGLGHPVLRSDSLGKNTFVPNDVSIGGFDSASFILLTGPNMGGKSTLLRQVCLAIILAQVGVDVPATSFELSLVDKIFVRMGAKDHIMAGQSTFLTELLDTSKMLSCATRNSFVALDELGRGTSTSDGQAIAESVLEHLVHNAQARGMFSTHYHRLAVHYEKDEKVSLCHMGCQVGKGESDLEEVTFLYRLTPGACPKSYGVNVARLAGLPESVLYKAAAKSQEFERTYGRSERGIENAMRSLCEVLAKNSSCHETGEENITTSLVQIQRRVQSILSKDDTIPVC
ncbi:DNA mismatch repair protein MSH6-like [Impatiens glandulifera]|uniref:DNA mismatch repair protein MSH6-like n=1 Tax=Impatiens glandulifera TaxID=253017 RepID=UPI001FB0C58C|nr:DNA mismatch repair protein MSH6-like [Impatiens glandulifera]